MICDRRHDYGLIFLSWLFYHLSSNPVCWHGAQVLACGMEGERVSVTPTCFRIQMLRFCEVQSAIGTEDSDPLAYIRHEDLMTTRPNKTSILGRSFYPSSRS
jgi:hypothetical protein